MPPTRQALRAAIATCYTKSNARAWLTAVVDIAAFCLFFGLAATSGPLLLRIPSAFAEAICMARLFILGHDVCHGSLFTRPWQRAIFGRILFLPTLTTYSLWQIGHNSVHHGYTNLKGRDSVWPPFSPQEFASLPPLRRALEHVYRSPIGQGLYYFCEIWWKQLFQPAPTRSTRPSYWLDSWLVAAFAALAIGVAKTPTAIILSCLLPFAFWNHLMGLVIYLHHTHPDTKWYRDRESWSFTAGQLDSTIHAELPFGLHRLLHNILEHTAHHIDVTIPFYALPKAQRQLEETFQGHIVRQPWSWRAFLHTTRTCQLFDFDRQTWVPFRPPATP